jgi:hypothetical protein
MELEGLAIIIIGVVIVSVIASVLIFSGGDQIPEGCSISINHTDSYTTIIYQPMMAGKVMIMQQYPVRHEREYMTCINGSAFDRGYT